MNIELFRYQVKEGKSARVDEWLAFLNDHMADVLVTLEGEKMYVETIFRETIKGVEYLYWYMVFGDDGIIVDDSSHWIDIKHLEYWEDCIDKEYGEVQLQTEVVMIPDKIKKSMNE